jgi:hypothetical protein
MKRKKRGEITENFRGDRIAPELLEIQRKFARAAIDHADALRMADPDMGSLFNRDADNWRPMFAIAEIAGRRWPQHIREVAQSAVAAKAEQSIREKLLADIRRIFDGKPETRDGKTVTEYEPVDKMSSAELAIILARWNAGLERMERRQTDPQAALAQVQISRPCQAPSGSWRPHPGPQREDRMFSSVISPKSASHRHNPITRAL